MRKHENVPTEHLVAPQIISNGKVNLVNGYMTVADGSQNQSVSSAQIYTIQVMVDGETKNLDVYVAGSPY